MDYAILRKHSSLTSKMEAMKVEHEASRQLVMAELKQDNLKSEENEYGKFTVAARTSYKYTEAVDKLSDKVKVAKAKEEQSGAAKSNVTEYLVYKAV